MRKILSTLSSHERYSSGSLEPVTLGMVNLSLPKVSSSLRFRWRRCHDFGGHLHHPSSHVLLGDGGVALAVVEVPRLVVELGFDDELGELARVVSAGED